MPSGLEIYTNDGHLQLSSDGIYFRLNQKVVLDNSGWSQHGTNGSYRDVTFSGVSVSDAPMLALASPSSAWHRQISSTGSSVTFRVYRASAAGDSVTCWLFDKSLPPTDPPPFSLYNAAGQCVFNANYPPARPIGRYVNGAYTGLNRTGRTLAFVPQTRRSSQYSTYTAGGYGSCVMGGGIQGYQQYQQTGWTEGALVCWGENISVQDLYMQVGPFPYYCSPSSSLPANTSTGTTGATSALILDVTGY